MTTTIFSSDAGAYGSHVAGVLASFHIDGLNPLPLADYQNAIPNPLADFGIVMFSVDLPQGCTVNQALLRLYITHADSGSLGVTFRGVDQDNGTWPVDYHEASTRDLTAATADSPFGAMVGGTVVEWDVTDILQEIVDRPGFTGPFVSFQVVSIDPSEHGQEFATDDGDADLWKRPTLLIDASGTADGVADDDCYWNVGSFSNVIQGADYLHVSGNGPGRFSAMVRFPGGIPKGANIVSARLGFHQKSGTTGGYPATVRVFDVLGEVSTFPTTCLDADNLASTAGSWFDMTVDGPGHAAFDPFTVDVKSQIEELVAQSGWTALKQVAFYFYQTTLGGDFIPMSIESGTPITLTVIWGADSGGGGGTGPGGQTGVNASALWMLFDSKE